MPYIRIMSTSEPSLLEEKWNYEPTRHRGILSFLKYKLAKTESQIISHKDYDDSSSWVFVPIKSRSKLSDSPHKALCRAGPNTPRRNRRQVKTSNHTWSRKQLAKVWILAMLYMLEKTGFVKSHVFTVKMTDSLRLA